MKTKHDFPIPRPRPAIVSALLGLAAVSANAAMSPPVPSATPGAPPAMTSTAPVANEDIRDIRGPIHIPSRLPWVVGTATAATLLAAGYGAWRWSRKGQRALLPFEIALAKLEAARPLMQPETAREFSIAVSEVLRAFIEECFPVRAAHRTTDEFLHDLASQADSPLAAHHETFEHFLNLCDLAKFARWHLTAPQMEALFESARTFVLSIGAPTKAQPATPASEPALVTS
jgi:hypothetical protein